MPSRSKVENLDVAWYARRERLRKVLEHRGPISAADLAAHLDWDLREVSAKLQDLRRAGMADRSDQRADGRLWWAT